MRVNVFLRLVMPLHPQKVFFMVVMEFKFALVSMLYRFAATSGEVDVGRRDQHSFRLLLDIDDSL